jgi:hypothetical protein
MRVGELLEEELGARGVAAVEEVLLGALALDGRHRRVNGLGSYQGHGGSWVTSWPTTTGR